MRPESVQKPVNGEVKIPAVRRGGEGKEVDGMKKEKPALTEIIEERDRLITRVGDSEVVQTKEGITIQARCTNRPNFLSEGD